MDAELTGFASGLDMGYVLWRKVKDDPWFSDFSNLSRPLLRRGNSQMKPVWKAGPGGQFCTR